MTRGEILTDVRGFLNAAVSGYFTPTILGMKTNQAYHQAQAIIRNVSRSEFRARARTSIVANTARYPRATFEPVIAYRILDSAAGQYRDMEEQTEEQLTGDAVGSPNRSSSHVRQAYFVDGGDIVLVPTPTAAVTNGLECKFYDLISMTSDLDEPRMPAALHPLIAFRAAWLCVQDTKDAGAEIVRLWDREWQSHFGTSDESAKNLSRHYPQMQGRRLTPDVRWPGRTA